MTQTWEATVHDTKQQDAGCDVAMDGGRCTAKGRGKKPDKGPGKYAFLPWLLMGTGAFSNIVQGKTDHPWLASLGLLAFNSFYVTVVWSAFSPRLRDSRYP